MVKLIRFCFLTGDDVDDAKNPLADAAFAAQIGAKLIREANEFFSEYELRNTATGTRFTFEIFLIFLAFFSRMIIPSYETEMLVVGLDEVKGFF